MKSKEGNIVGELAVDSPTPVIIALFLLFQNVWNVLLPILPNTSQYRPERSVERSRVEYRQAWCQRQFTNHKSRFTPPKIAYALKRICMRVWHEPFTPEQEERMTGIITAYRSALQVDFMSIFDYISKLLSPDQQRIPTPNSLL